MKKILFSLMYMGIINSAELTRKENFFCDGDIVSQEQKNVSDSLILSLKTQFQPTHHPISKIAVRENNLLINYDDRYIELWNINEAKKLDSYLLKNSVSAISLADGRAKIVQEDPCEIWSWNGATSEGAKINGSERSYSAFSTSGNLYIHCDNFIYELCVKNIIPKTLRALKTKYINMTNPLGKNCFNTSDNTLVFNNLDGNKIYQILPNNSEVCLEGTTCCKGPGNTFFIGDKKGNIFRISSSRPTTIPSSLEMKIKQVAMHKDAITHMDCLKNRYIVSTDKGNADIKITKLEDNCSLPSIKNIVRVTALCCSGNYIIAGREDGTIKIWQCKDLS